MIRWVVLIALVVSVYAQTRTAGWVYEDDNMRVSAETVIVPRHVPSRELSIFVRSRLPDTARTAHLCSVGLHVVNGALVGVLAAELGGAAWIAAGLFWLHPLNVEAVAYAAEQSELMSAFGLLLAIIAWRRHWWIVALFGAAIALLGKETGIMVFPLAGWLWLQDEPDWRFSSAAYLCALLGLGWAEFVTFPQDVSLSAWRWFGVQSVGVWGLARRVVLPLGLTPDPAWWRYGTAWQVVAAISVMVAALVIWKQRRRGLVLTGCGWALIALAPRLLIRIPLGWLTEHHSYTAMVGVALAASSMLSSKVDMKR